MSEQRVWICDCGCVSGYLYEDGSFRCANCNEFASHSEPPKFIPEAVNAPVLVEPQDAFKIVDMNSTGAAYDRIVRKLQTRKEEVVGFVVLFANGSHSNWFNVEGDAQCDWANSYLDEMKEYIDAKFRNKPAIRQG